MIREIEERLSVALPPAYVELLRDRDPAFFWANGLLGDPEDVVIANLNLRDSETTQARTWPEGYVVIGDDGFGNMLFLDVARAHVLFWNHETDTFDDLGSLPEFIAAHAPTEEDRLAYERREEEEEDTELAVTRMRPAERSILNPIRLAEWKEYIATDRSMELRGYAERRSPFDGSTVRFAYPGLARWRSETMGDVDLMLAHGRISIAEIIDVDRPLTIEAKAKLEGIAKALDAMCVGTTHEGCDPIG
jgi:hypothetical protein